MSQLFSPLKLRGTSIRNRAWVSPMCQYSSVDGFPNDWHLMHLGQFAAGGAGLVMTEATAVTAEGRISPFDAGIWNDEQAEAYRRITGFVAEQGATPGIQLGHAGRKASTSRPWSGHGYVQPEDGGWATVGPSAVPFGSWPAPRELTEHEVSALAGDFAAAAVRADEVGFQLVELHAAHGYLLHQFLSPLSNRRRDRYGGDLAGRSRALLETVDAVRAVWPEDKPLLVRVSASDWVDGGWDLEQTVTLAGWLAERGVDLVDVSSGGLSPQQQITVGPGYQVPFAQAVRERAGVPVSAVGMITTARQAEDILSQGQADAVMLARELLRRPHWALEAAHDLGEAPSTDPDDAVAWAPQYERAQPA